MALLHAAPWLAREHLLRCAAPPVPRGRRAALVASADRPRRAHAFLRRLPLAAVRDLPVRRRRPATPACSTRRSRSSKAARCKPDEESYYDLPQRSDETGTLYEHCVRAIEHGLRFGAHGLPLMGCGDWNDGMNLVGEQGKGESVWLAFFLYDVLQRFARAGASAAATTQFAEQCTTEAAQLQQNIEAARLGRRLVPARLLRRRHAARLGHERRNARSIPSPRAGRCYRARRSGRGRGRPWTAWINAWSARRAA